MQTQKVQITLTTEEIAALALKSRKFGYSPTKYIKFIVMKEASSVIDSIPANPLPPSLEKRTMQALDEHKKKKTKKLAQASDFNNI